MRYRKFLLAVGFLLLMAVFVAARPQEEGTPPWLTRKAAEEREPQVRRPGTQALTTADLQRVFPYLSGGAQRVLAPKLGIDTLMGKKLDVSTQLGLDNIVSAEDIFFENEPSIAVNPVNESIVVAFHHYYTPGGADPCLAVVSFDGGDTFNYNNAVPLPLQAGGNSCSDPIVRFSPDGQVAYFVYMDIDGTTDLADIVMVRADGYDPRILIDATPIVVLNNFGTDGLDKPWMDVAYYDTTGASDPVVYVTATVFVGANCGILFNSSMDYGATWLYGDWGLMVDSSTNCDPVLQGSRPIGNPYSGWVTVCWYDSGFDGWLSGGFFINCWSNDAWGDVALGTDYYFMADYRNYEPSYWMGPSSMYQRWWGSAFPALAVDDTGLLYIGFTADPTRNPSDAEAGDVYLARGWPDGTFWKTMVVADGGPVKKTQGRATVTARCDEKTNKCYTYVAFEEYKRKNELYRVVYRKFTRPYKWFFKPGRMRKGRIVQISDTWSLNDYSFIGDYIDSFLTDRRYGVIWTDRADATSIYDEDDDVLMDVMVP